MNQLVPFENGQAPAVFAGRRSLLTQYAQQGVQASFAVLSYRGKNWRIKYRGEEQLLKDTNGQPVPFLDVIIVGMSQSVSKIYYQGGYEPGNNDPPDCSSKDGLVPDPGVPDKQSDTCALCPNNEWGSRITQSGAKGKACQDSRRIAVVPLDDPLNEAFGGPMLLRIPPMSLQTLMLYAQYVERKGACFEALATRIGFDHDTEYPKLTFQAIGWVSPQDAELVVGPDGNGGVCADPALKRMLVDTNVVEADPLAKGGPAPAFTNRGAPSVIPAPQPALPPAPPPAPTQAFVPDPAPIQSQELPRRGRKPVLKPHNSAATNGGAAPTQPMTDVQPASDDLESQIADLLGC